MLRRVLASLLVCAPACNSDMPPPLGDPDVAYYAEVIARPPLLEAGADADAGAPTANLDFEGVCTAGEIPVWHFFDFETSTPNGSALDFTAFSAATQAGLDTAPGAHLATVTGPDITVWQGVDVDPKLQSINQTSKLFLRVRVAFLQAPDGTWPTLTHYRQEYDCIVGQ